MRNTLESAFTLVELLLVVVILGILAAVAIPQFSDSSGEAKASTLQTNLAVIRNAAEYYRANHNGKYPGYPAAGGAPTAAETLNQFTLVSKVDGSSAAVGTAGFPYGPYIREKLPENPVSGLTTVLVVADGAVFPAADNSTGWIYQPQSGRIRANSTGAAPSGKNWYDY